MQDIEFTIQEGRLWMLQCRVGKRNGPAAAPHGRRHARREADHQRGRRSCASPPAQLDELLHPIVDPAAEKTAQTRSPRGCRPVPAAPCGQIVFTAADAVEWAKQGKKVILVREETNPEDVEGMRAATASSPRAAA